MNWLLALPFLIYYIVYPGGKKNWTKCKRKIDFYAFDKSKLEDELKQMEDELMELEK
jgi:hypothetical protein